MTAYMFYLQIRRVELMNEAKNENSIKMPEVKEITKTVSEEWKQLDEVKKKHFNIPAEI